MLIDPVKYLHHVVIPAVDQNDENDNKDMGGKESGKHRRKQEEFALEEDAYGLPVMPDIEDLSLENKKSLIRTFLTRHYSMFDELNI